MYCEQCGTQIENGNNICQKCINIKNKEKNKDKIISIIIISFLTFSIIFSSFLAIITG